MFGDDYADFIIYYLNNPVVLEKYKDAIIEYINEAFAIVHIPVTQINQRLVYTYGYSVIPSLFGLTSEVSVEASGVKNLRNIPNLDLRGEGTLIGIVDTGVDYTNPLLFKADGSTKLVSLWDQTIVTGPSPYLSDFGTEYSAQQINEAIASNSPYDIVPSRDDIGHGTMMAAVAAGNEDANAQFAGVAPDAELVIVKLRQAKPYLKDFFRIPEGIICYQENHIMWGVQYCIQKSLELRKPISICVGLGSSQGPHDGRTPLSIFLSLLADLPRIGISVSAGNEGNLGRHFYGNIIQSIGYNTVELNVGDQDKSFSMELWGNSPGIYSIDILSPGGEYIPRIAASLRVNREISFIFEETVINIDYIMTESETGDQLILMRFQNTTPGSWRFNVYGQGNFPLSFHIWLPMDDMITRDTYFLKADIYTTVLAPGTSEIPITLTAYNPNNNTLFVNSSRGYTRGNAIKPTIAAPGVNYIAPNNNKEFVTYSGTGVATAHTSGILSMLLEWGVIRGNNLNIDTIAMKTFLVAGAKRNPNTSYPNRDWGFGILDIYNVFETLRIDYGAR